MAEVKKKKYSLLIQNVGDIPGCESLISLSGKAMKEGIDPAIFRAGSGVMVWASNTYIPPLEEHVHTDAEVRRLNNKGIHIYLFEPMCSYYEGDEGKIFSQFNFGFYSEFPNEMPPLETIGAAELDSIQKYVRNNGLTNVTVHTGDYDVDKYYVRYADDFKMICDDLFLKTLSMFDHIDSSPKENISKKFITTGWRFTTARCLISSMLAKLDSHIAWYFKIPFNVLKRHKQWIDLDRIFLEEPKLYKKLLFGLEALNNGAPWVLDQPAESATELTECYGHMYPQNVGIYGGHANPVADNAYHLRLQPFYREAFVDLVCESRYAQPTANISEKVFQAIQFRTPFVMVGPPRSLQYLKDLGFQTFDRWWDESYDDEADHLKRFLKICEIINYIDSLSYGQLQSIQQEMALVHEHNFNVLVDLIPGGLRDHTRIKWDEIEEVRWAHDDTKLIHKDTGVDYHAE